MPLVDLSAVRVNPNYREMRPPKTSDNPEFHCGTPERLCGHLMCAPVTLREGSKVIHQTFLYIVHRPLTLGYPLTFGLVREMERLHQNYMATTRGLKA